MARVGSISTAFCSVVIVFLMSNIVKAQDFSFLPAELTPESIEKINQHLVSLGDVNWSVFLAKLRQKGNTQVVRYTEAYANLLRQAVWKGYQALETLWSLQKKQAAKTDHKSKRLAAALLLAIGRGHLHLSHNLQGLDTLTQAVVAMRQIDDQQGLVRALYALSEGLIERSRRPWSALAYINELLLVANRAQMHEYTHSAKRLYGKWRRQITLVDDYFGRATNRMQLFHSSIGVPVPGDLVAVVDGVFVMSQETDGQSEESDPRLWLYDGLFIHELALPDPTLRLRGTLIDDQRRIWMATNRGVYLYDQQQFHHLLNPQLADENSNNLHSAMTNPKQGVEQHNVGLPSNIINDIRQGPKQKLLLATKAGLTLLDPNDFSVELIKHGLNAPNDFGNATYTPEGELIATWKKGYVIRDKKGDWSQFDFRFDTLSGAKQGMLFGLTDDRSGTWLHGLGGAILRRTGRIERIVTDAFSPQTGNVNYVLQSQDGAFWFATPDGICRQQGSFCAGLDSNRWLPAQWTLHLMEWPDNNIWACVFPYGLIHFAPPNTRQYGRPEGFYQRINADAMDLDGSLYFVNGAGLTKFNPENQVVDNFFSKAEGIPVPLGFNASGVRLSTGEIALVADGIRDRKGIILFDGRRAESLGKKDGLLDEQIIDFCEVEHGVLLVASSSAVMRVDTLLRKSGRAIEFEPVVSQSIRNLSCKPGEDVWVLTSNDELFQLVGGQLRRVDSRQSLIHGKYRKLIPTKTAGLFLVAEKSLSRYYKGKWQRIDTQANDFNYDVRSVAQDAQGQLYFATSSGVYVHNQEDWTLLTAADGLLSDTSYGVLQHEGQMWIVNHGGITQWNWPQQHAPETFLLARHHAYYVDDTGSPKKLRVSSGKQHAGWVGLTSIAQDFEIPRAQAERLWPPPRRPPTKAYNPICDAAAGMSDSVAYSTADLEFRVLAMVPYMDDKPDEFFYRYRLDRGSWHLVHDQTIRLVGLTDGAHTVEVRSTDKRLKQDQTFAYYCFAVDTPLSPLSIGSIGFVFILFVVAGRRQIFWIVRRFRHRKFKPIEPSPFSPDRPAEKNFAGRETQIASIRNLLHTGGVAVLWGDRGAGKHSLIRKLARDLSSDTILTVELDLATVAAGGDLSSLVESMSNGLIEVLEAKKEQLLIADQVEESGISRFLNMTMDDYSIFESADSSSETHSKRSSATASGQVERNPFSLLGQLLRRVEHFLPDVRIIYLLDNAEVLGLAMDTDAAYGSYLFPFLRSQAQQRSNLVLILSLEGRWIDLTKRFEQVFAFATPVAVGPLSQAQCSSLIRQSLADRALLSGKCIDELVSLSGQIPYLIQLIGDRLVSSLNAKRTNLCSHKIIEDLAETLVISAAQFLEKTWLELAREEKLILVALCESGPKSRDTYTVKGLVDRLIKNGGTILMEEARRACQALELDGTLQFEDKHYRPRCDLLRRWVVRHHTIKSVLEESHDYISHYQLYKCLGEGGMGVVYKARDMVTGQTVAIKLLRTQLSKSKRSRRRFLREARLGKRLEHPNIVNILDYGQQAGRLYLAMEFLEGQTLTQWLKKSRRPSILQVAQVGVNLASALDAVHELGILHRDIKSDNIMITSQQPSDANDSQNSFQPTDVKLMDFGLATGQDVSRVTRAGSLLGTIAYMSPEQAKGNEYDVRSDLYSLGVVLYEMLTGSTPFSGSDTAVLHSIISDEIPPVQHRFPEVDQNLAALVDQLLCKDPLGRPRSALDVRARLEGMVSRLEQKQAMGQTIAQVPSYAQSSDQSNSDSLSSPGMQSRTIEVLRNSAFMLSTMVPTSLRDSTGSCDDLTDPAWSLIYNVSASIAKESVGDSILSSCLEQCAQTLKADRGLIVLHADSVLLCKALYQREVDTFETLPQLSELINKSIAGQMGILYVAEPQNVEQDMSTAVCAPLWSGDEILGVMVLDRVGLSAQSFLDRDLEILACIGYLLGLGLERERLYQQVLDQERMVVAGQMLAGVAHDMRNPMAVISGYSQLIADSPEQEVRDSYSRIIIQQVDGIVAMIRNLLAYVRGEQELQITAVDLNQLAEDVKLSLHEELEAKQIEFSTDIDGKYAYLDESRTMRIILNLCKNAIDVLQAGDKLQLQLQEQDGGLDIRVSDSGPGIPEEIRPTLFEPFVTKGKKTGTGLGLAIVKRFVDDHRGSLELQTSKEGTVFQVKLPDASVL